MDLQSLLSGAGSDPTGLLTPQQQGDVNSTTLQSIGAAMMKAGGPSPYKAGMTTLSGIGDALSTGLAARRQAQQDALTQTMVRAKTLEGIAPLLKLKQQYDTLGIPMSPEFQRIIDATTNLAVPGGMPPRAPGAPAPVSPQQNLIVDTARKLGINLGMLLPDAPGHETAMKTIYDHLAVQGQQEKKTFDIMAEDSGKRYAGLQGMARLGQTVKDVTDLAHVAMNDPNFRSGLGAELENSWQRLLVATGHDPGLAWSREVFKKVTAEALQAQIEEAKAEAAQMGGSAGRVYAQQIGIMMGASPNLDLSDAANRTLVAQMRARADKAMTLGELSSHHMIANNNILGPKWDIAVRQWEKDNPQVLTGARQQATTGIPSAGPVAAPAGPGMIPGLASPTGPAAPAFAGGTVPPAFPGGIPPGVQVHQNPKTGKMGYIDPKTGKWTLIN